MSHSIETIFARDPSRGAEAMERHALGCLACTNSRATQWETFCLPAKNIGKPVSRVPFPHSGPGCPHFNERP